MDIPITYGDPTIGRPFEAKWQSGADTIILKVYKETASETSEQWTERIIAAVDAELGNHPI